MKIKYHQQILKIKTTKMKMKSKKKKAYVSPKVKCLDVEPVEVLAGSINGVTEEWQLNEDASGSDDLGLR